jgi:outer membrane protein
MHTTRLSILLAGSLLIGVSMAPVTAALPAAAPAGELKIGTVDLQKIFQGYWKTRVADAELKDEASKFDKTRKAMVEDYQKAREDYQKLLDSANDQAVSTEERDKRKKSAENKLREIQSIEQQVGQFDRSTRTALADKQSTRRDKIVVELKGVIAAKARAEGYTMVIDVSAESINYTSIILYNDGKSDLTEQLLKQLNETAPPGVLDADNGKKPANGNGKKEDKKDEKKDEKKEP